MEKNKHFVLDLQYFAEVEEDLLDLEDFEDEEEKEDKKEETETEKQNRKKNAEEARKRREREQKEREDKIRKEAYEQGKKDGEKSTLKVNEFTNQPIENDEDVEIAKFMKELKEKGKDPINDFPKEWARREAQRRAENLEKEKKEEEKKEWSKNDRANFLKKVGSKEKALDILKDEKFRIFAKGRVGNEPLVDIYDEFLSFTKLYAKDDGANSKLPSAQGGGASHQKSVKDMTQEEFKEYWRNKYHN